MSRTGITKQPNGKYRAFVDCGCDFDGKRIRKTKVCSTEKEAVLWQSEMRCEAERMDMSNYDIKLCDLAKKWRQSKQNKGVALSTMLKYDNILRILGEYKEPMYEKKAREVKNHEISAFFNYLAFEKNLSLSYIKNDVRATLSQIFNYGIENDMILKNPCKRAELPKVKDSKKEKDAFTPKEIKAIEEHCANIPFGDIIYILLNTGMRSQEICAIDEKSLIVGEDGQRFIRVDKAMNKTRGGWEIGSTKTDSSIRNIPIDDKIYKLMMERIIANKDHFLLPGRKAGTHISYDNFNKHYKRFFDILNTVSKTKVRYLPPHCCRHTLNSRLIWAGVSPFVIQSIMGHASADMTENYAHVMGEHTVEAMRKIKVV